ncbi:hypothetical protein A5886_001533 [Enterococcus sp. 8G7_MSG3316]|uniref:Uncharacterized protein n=1 Tax=Candidatus Enterococcus testudinis TaxID=1834191 RepID=A0A242A5Z0_9ENTE|nr:hypothetical protein [Enterococcus sp. 8G7_MSG3316]OTN76456.1 hypothetical protein A5886_001533 [Enterococcus sp. 8G7_MSG3316]
MAGAARYFQTMKQKSMAVWEDFVDDVYRNQRRTLITLSAGIVLALIFAGIILFSQQQIKASLVDRMAFNQLPSEKVAPLTYATADQTIEETKAISVMFSKPHGEDLDQVYQLIDAQEEELNRTFYYYPIVYDTAGFVDQYQVDPNKVTFVFYEEGVEKNRFTFDSFDDPQNEFVPELNRLPMWTIRSLDDEE